MNNESILFRTFHELANENNISLESNNKHTNRRYLWELQRYIGVRSVDM